MIHAVVDEDNSRKGFRIAWGNGREVSRCYSDPDSKKAGRSQKFVVPKRTQVAMKCPRLLSCCSQNTRGSSISMLGRFSKGQQSLSDRIQATAKNTLITKQLWKVKIRKSHHVSPFQLLIHFTFCTLLEQQENQKVLLEIKVVLVLVLTIAWKTFLILMKVEFISLEVILVGLSDIVSLFTDHSSDALESFSLKVSLLSGKNFCYMIV